MQKYLVAIAFVCGFAFYVSIEYEQHSQDGTGQPPISRTAPITSTANDQTKSYVSDTKWHPPSWYRLFAWPDGITTWGILLTLVAIAEQTSETRKAAEAGEASASAALEQTRLQAAGMKPWIDVSILRLEDQGRGRNSVGEYLPSHRIRIWIEAKNTSPCALTMQVVTALVTIGDPKVEMYFECREPMPVAPSGAKDDRYSLPIPLALTDQMFDDYRSGSLTFPIVGTIYFDSSVGPPDKQMYWVSALCSNRSVRDLPLVAEMRPKELPSNQTGEDRNPN